jgi:hypothetical protein
MADTKCARWIATICRSRAARRGTNIAVPANSTNAMTTPPDSRRRHRRLQTQRTTAKTGMAVAMGVLVWSAMAGRRVLRRYHPLAGVALLGFTAWHMALYKPKSREAAAK